MKQNKQIAYYLEGHFPRHIITQDILLFIDTIQQFYPTEFSDQKLIAYLKDIPRFEFYYTILNKLYRLSKRVYSRILDDLNVPEEVIESELIGF